MASLVSKHHRRPPKPKMFLPTASTSPVTMPPAALTIISLGNPPPYERTLHSAGHISIQSLQRLLNKGYTPQASPLRRGSNPNETAAPQDKFQTRNPRHVPYHLLSASARLSLHISPTLMNRTGEFVHKLLMSQIMSHNVQHSHPTKRQFIRPIPIVIIHDELDLPLGEVKLIDYHRSPRGHNGVRSVHHWLGQNEDELKLFYRIAVGIGRPESRLSGDVQEWVLRQMTGKEEKVLSETGQAVLDAVEKIEAKVAERVGWDEVQKMAKGREVNDTRGVDLKTFGSERAGDGDGKGGIGRVAKTKQKKARVQSYKNQLRKNAVEERVG